MACNDAAAAPHVAFSEAGGSAQLPPQCPDDIRILVVDNDLISLKTIINMSNVCHYKVTTCKCDVEAVEILRNNEFDIVLANLHILDVDGFAFQEIVQSEMGLPLIFMSADDVNDRVKNGCGNLKKPLRFEDFKKLGQYVLRKKEKNACLENSRGSKEIEEREYSSGSKKRVIWVPQLHDQFVKAVDKLGVERAVPKKILELMSVPGLTRENVASHLQKYRLFLKKRNGKENQNIAPPHFQVAPDPCYYEGLAGYGQLPLQSIMTHNLTPGRATNVCMDITNTGNENFYNSYAPRIMPTEMQEMNMTPWLTTSSSFSCNALSGHDNSLCHHQSNECLDATISEHDLGQQMYSYGVPDHNLHENYMNTAYGTYPHVSSSSECMVQGLENAVPNYEMSNEFPQSRNQDMELQSINQPYVSGLIYVTEQNNMGIGPSISAHQNFSGRNESEEDLQHNPVIQMGNSTGLKEEAQESTHYEFYGHIPSDYYVQEQESVQDDLNMFLLQYRNVNTVEDVEEDGDP